ncbi:MAG: replicative DNA helicase [Simkaniaceae bacterium]|nr:replicative DNA helicase [Simkaniaceae bacterium]
MAEEKKKKDSIVKVAPNSKESEMMVLGCMLTSVNALNAGADSLQEKDFYYTEHQHVFQALSQAYHNDKPADVHLIAEMMRQSGKLESAGGVSYLTTLAQYAGTSAYIEEYALLVKNKSILRQMISAAQTVERNALGENEDVQSILDDAQSLFFKISQAANTQQGIQMRDILSGERSESGISYLKELQERQEEFHNRDPNAPPITGLATHFSDLDKMTNGLNPANLVIVAGRPSMGKTAFALNIAENVAFKSNGAVGIFSLEMTAQELLHRFICSQSEVESDKIRTGSLDGIEYQRIVSAVNEMQNKKIIIDDQPGLKITDLRARARRLKEVFDIKVLIVDYLQLLSGSKSNYNSDNRQNEIAEISRMLKNTARELNIPIICPSQLSRKVEERAGHRPMLSDLRESGSIEQDADIVMFLFRPEYYNPQHKPGMAELIIAKNRQGKVGSVNLTFRKTFAQFCDYTPADGEGEEAPNEAFAAFSPEE